MREYIKIYCNKLLKEVQASYKVLYSSVNGKTDYEFGESNCQTECKDCPGLMKECIQSTAVSDFQRKYFKGLTI